MSDQNIMDEFERMLENMNLTEEKKVLIIMVSISSWPPSHRDHHGLHLIMIIMASISS